MKHSLKEKFDGSKPIAVLDFRRSFNKSADQNQVGGGAAARLMPYCLKGPAKDEYISYLKEAPALKPLYPYMVKYLLKTNASPGPVGVGSWVWVFVGFCKNPISSERGKVEGFGGLCVYIRHGK
jgi:hypothetical protein